MDLSSDRGSLQLTPITSTSPSVIAPRMAPHTTFSTPKLYTMYGRFQNNAKYWQKPANFHTAFYLTYTII